MSGSQVVEEPRPLRIIAPIAESSMPKVEVDRVFAYAMKARPMPGAIHTTM